MGNAVVDATYFHINSNANGSPHDLMRRGSVIEVGDQTIPFFRYFESYQRTYPVQLPDGSSQVVPAIRFLELVKDGTVNTKVLPNIACEVARHFMILSRELVWENVRLQNFRDEPSRQRCLFLLERADQARDWIKLLGFAPGTHWIVRLKATGTALKVDSRQLAGDSEPLSAWYEKARRYWRGELTDNPMTEVLFVGTVHVEEILNIESIG
jgi:hypothetical protein